MKNGIDNTKPENLSYFNCVFLKNINGTNYVYSSQNTDSFVKKQYGNNLNNISPNDKFYLKIDGKYITIQQSDGQIYLTWVPDVSNATSFKFNNNGNIIEPLSGKCVQINGNYLFLQHCIQDNVEQEFIYESKSNTIRPITNNLNKNLCFTLGSKQNSIHGIQNIVLENCNFSDNKYQSIDKQNLETFDSVNSDLNDLKKVNFCSNSVYKTIVTSILCCILIYFIWYLIKKEYKDNRNFDIFNKTSTIIN
jgi:hypothetical protein